MVENIQLSEEEQQQFLMKLWNLLKWQAEKYNGIDSTSMPIEKAQDLLASLVYTLAVASHEDGLSPNILLQGDLRQAVKRGQEILDNKRQKLNQKWNRLCLDAPDIRNVYYVTTLKNLGLFFKRYDIYYEAHQIPCSIDYPLLNPVSENLKGIGYVEEYIRHIKTENDFINSFEHKTVIDLLQLGIPDYRENFINLCEPVLINAIAKKLLGQEINTLGIHKEDISVLMSCFEKKSTEEIIITVNASIASLCKEINFEADKVSYFMEEIKSLALRIENAAKSACLANIFISSL